MLRMKLTVRGTDGLHARPASQLCALTRSFESEICLLANHHQLDGKSILDLMSGGLICGTVIELVCSGRDEAAAMEAICTFFAEMS